jgi:hypothetical protein
MRNRVSHRLRTRLSLFDVGIRISRQEGVMPEFQEARRSETSLLAPLEKRTLLWLSARLPSW